MLELKNITKEYKSGDTTVNALNGCNGNGRIARS